ncbi:unnamed protein product [Rhizoctonia solani]|uniref:Nephrocystin 3-like N-terminal domain-containing protein n=1 Tax=Rhizoctonia solani TaxID=456999 RepID=A0A8H3AFL1_9AGAM|nr:unnamed protein product [Rhizoctonia solani]
MPTNPSIEPHEFESSTDGSAAPMRIPSSISRVQTDLSNLEVALATDEYPELRSAISGIRTCMAQTEDVINGEYWQVYEGIALRLINLARNIHSALPRLIVPTKRHPVIPRIRRTVVQIKLRRERFAKIEPIGSIVEQETTQYLVITYLLGQLHIELENTHGLSAPVRSSLVERWRVPVYHARYNAIWQTQNQRARIPGTCQEILDAIQHWTENKGPKIYWMTGESGTGKTIIARTICEYLDREKRLGASFFCSSTHESCQDTSRIIPTIAYQLARFSSRYLDMLATPLRESESTDRSLSTQFNQLVIPLIHKRIIRAIPSNVVVVIDALDECSDVTGLWTILELLRQNAENLHIKFLLTSRPNILKSLPVSFLNNTSTIQLHDLREAVELDAHLHLTNVLLRILLPRDGVNQLSKLAGGLFIFATTVTRFLLPGA